MRYLFIVMAMMIMASCVRKPVQVIIEPNSQYSTKLDSMDVKLNMAAFRAGFIRGMNARNKSENINTLKNLYTIDSLKFRKVIEK